MRGVRSARGGAWCAERPKLYILCALAAKLEIEDKKPRPDSSARQMG
jgi:hypothetical protein